MSTSHPTMMGGSPLMPHRLERAKRAGKRSIFGELRSSRSLKAPALITAVLLALSVLLVPGSASAATGDVGTEGPSHSGTGTPTGTKRAESILWYNDGSWWGNLWDTDTSDFHIFRFNAATDSWEDTGVPTEPRANTHHDVLWDGTTLYVASNLFVNDEAPAAAGSPSWLRRYSYNATTKTYAPLESSNPNSTPEVNDTQINNFRTETLTIDKDSTGRLWATWQQGNKIYLNVTGTDGNTWGVPFPHPDANVSVDDNSALIAFGPGKMGLMWSSQPGNATDGFYWSVHTDGAASTTWSPKTAITAGERSGDDHMNLKWLDSSGPRVFAAVKTSFTSSTQPLIELLAMDSTGTWTQHTIANVSECPNRVIVLIDEGSQRLRTFATYPKPAGTTKAGVCSTSGGAIYEKSTPLNNIDFTTSTKTARIVDADQYVHNVSSTKQNLNKAGTGTATSGLMVIADVNATKRYWYHFESGSPPPPDTTPPDTMIIGGPSGTTTSTSASFAFSSDEAGSTFECALDGGSFSACSSPKAYSNLSTGEHTFQVRATDLAGNTDQTPASRTWTIAADTTPPETTIDGGPSGTTTSTSASFTFSSSEEGSTFACRLDSGSFSDCESPKAYSGLSTGPHTFDVRATDAAGNTDASPASRTWTIEAGTPGSGIVRESVTDSVNTTAATTLTIPKPANTAQGDVLVSCVSLNGGSIGAAPAGWTLLESVTAVANPKVYGYSKVATSSEPASYSWTTSSTTSGGSITRYSGASGLDTSATSATSPPSGGTASSGSVPGVTTTTSNAMLVGCMSVNSSSVTLTSPTGMSQVIETGTRKFEFADGIQATAGASGTKTWTFSAAREWAGWLAALRPEVP
jgi:hypothetical protein